MLNTEVLGIVKKIALKYTMEKEMFASFIETESGGLGFSPTTNKIIIQFEPKWFARKAPYSPSGLWSLNKVDVQNKEWLAFNDAFSENPEAAMESTSIGMGQIMGFNYKLLGFDSVGEMWDDAKLGLENQVEQIAKLILAEPNLYTAVKNKDFNSIAGNYNGWGFKQLAAKLGRIPYDITMRNNYNKYLNLNWC
jgi:hypothetical protein